MILQAVAREFYVHLLDERSRSKPLLSSMVNDDHVIPASRLRYVSFFQPNGVAQTTSDQTDVVHVNIVRYEIFKDRRRIWTEHTEEPPGQMVSLNPPEYPIDPFKKSGRITGIWLYQAHIAEFPQAVFETLTETAKERIYNNLRFKIVLRGGLHWTVTREESLLDELDSTGRRVRPSRGHPRNDRPLRLDEI